MKLARVYGATLALLLSISLVAGVTSDGRAQSIDNEIWSHFLDTRTLYVRHCAPCHGHEGAEGLTPYAPGFALGVGLKRDYGSLLLSIQEGAGLMPPWESVLTYEEQDWLLFYSIVLQGDNVFRRQCATCHEQSPPLLQATIPRGDDLASYDGPIHVTRGTEVEPTWNSQDQGHVIRMLRGLAEER